MKGELINMARAWEQRKNLSPSRNRTQDVKNTGRALYLLSNENSWRARSLAVCRTLSHQNLVKWPRSTWALVARWDRAPAWSSGDHWFDSCRGVRLFSLSQLCWPFHLSHGVRCCESGDVCGIVASVLLINAIYTMPKICSRLFFFLDSTL